MSKEGDKATVFRATKVRTKLRDDGSWLQRRAEPEAETEEEEKPWLAEVRAGRVNGAPIETSPAPSPTKPTPAPIKPTPSATKPTPAPIKPTPSATKPTPAPNKPASTPTNSETQKAPQGYRTRGIFTPVNKPQSPTPSTNGPSSGKPQFTKKPSESYKKLAPYTVKPSLDSQESQLSPEEQERRTEAASSVLQKSAGRQRSYVLSAAKKFESPAETPESLPVNDSILPFVAKRVEIADDDSAATPAPATSPSPKPVTPITSAASVPQPKPRKPVSTAVKTDVDVTVNKPAAPKVEEKVAIPEPTKDEPAPVSVPEKDPFEGMTPGCTKVATPLPELIPQLVEAVSKEPEPEDTKLSGKVETPLVDLTPASTTPASPPPAATAPLSPTPASPAPPPAVPLSPTPVLISKGLPKWPPEGSSTEDPSVPLSPTLAPTSPTPALPKWPPEDSSTPVPEVPPSPAPAPVAPLSPTPASTTPASPLPAATAPLSPTPASPAPPPAVPLSPTPVITSKGLPKWPPEDSSTEDPSVPLSPTLAPTSPTPALPKWPPEDSPTSAPVAPLSPTPISPTPAPVVPLSPTPLSPTPAPVVPLSPTPLSPTPAPVVPLSPTPLSPTPAPVVPLSPTPLSPTPAPVVPLSPTPLSPTPAPVVPLSPTPAPTLPKSPSPTPLSPVPISTAFVSAVSEITVKTEPEPEPEPEQKEEPSPNPSSSVDTLTTLSDTLISFNTSSTSLREDEPKLALQKGGVTSSQTSKDSDEEGSAPKVSDCIPVTEDLLPLSDGPEAPAEPASPSLGHWSRDLLGGLDSDSNPTKTSRTLGPLDDDDVIVRNTGLRSLSMLPEKEKPTDETAKETQSSTETVTVTTKTVIITDKSEEDSVDPWRSRVKTSTVTESSSADPFDPYPIGTTSSNRSSDILQPLADISTNRSSTTIIERKDPSPDTNMSSNALESLADDVIPINTDATSLSTKRSWTRSWETTTTRSSYTEESQDIKPRVQAEDQNTMIMFERKSKENDSPWDRWTSPTVYAIPGQDDEDEEEEEEESREDTQTQTVTTITTIRERHSEPEPVMDRYNTYTRTVVEEQRAQTPEPETKKGFVYLKEYVNATELSLHNARDMAESGSDYLTSRSANYQYSTPPSGSLSSTCNYCGRPVGNDAKISIEHLNINCHPSCFKCGVCDKPMGDLLHSMFLHAGKVHCESCYSKAFD